MVAKNNFSKTGIKGYVWLLMAVFCIVFSSAFKRVIEIKTTPASYSGSFAFSKKIKDGSRDKHQYSSAITNSDHQSAANSDLSILFFLSSFITLALLYLSTGTTRGFTFVGQPAIPRGRSLYLQHSRLQVWFLSSFLLLLSNNIYILLLYSHKCNNYFNLQAW